MYTWILHGGISQKKISSVRRKIFLLKLYLRRFFISVLASFLLNITFTFIENSWKRHQIFEKYENLVEICTDKFVVLHLC